MNSNLAEQISSTSDVFAFVLSLPELHRVASNPLVAGDLKSQMVSCVQGLPDRAAIHLACLHVTRRFNAHPKDELLARVSALASAVDADKKLNLRARLTRAAVLYSNCSDYQGALSEFAACETRALSLEDDFAFGLANKGIADSARILGHHVRAEESYENALATFRKYRYDLLTAFVLNNLAILRKQWGEYSAALRLLKKARLEF